MFISQAWAEEAVQEVAQATAPVSIGGQFAGTFIQIFGVFLVFYLLLIRPQQKRMKQHEARLQALQVGDKVLTGGGLYAVVKKIEGDDLTLELTKGFEVKAPRFSIREVLTPVHPKTSQKTTK